MAKAFIAVIQKVEPIYIKGKEADSIQLATVMSESVVVNKDWEVGTKGVFFPADTQLSSEFCYYNNLFRDNTHNMDKTKGGFFETNRRVRCQPFCGAKSEGFFRNLRFLGLDKLARNNYTRSRR